jgi:hypothetical protein
MNMKPPEFHVIFSVAMPFTGLQDGEFDDKKGFEGLWADPGQRMPAGDLLPLRRTLRDGRKGFGLV